MKPYPYYQTQTVSSIKEIIELPYAQKPDKDVFRVRVSNTSYKSITWREFKEDVDAFGTALINSGLQKSHICVIGENSYEWVLTYMSVICSDSVIVPLDKELPAEKLADLIAFADAKAIVFSKSYAPMMKQIAPLLKDVTHYICMDDVPEFTSIPAQINKGKELLANGDTSFAEVVPDIEKMSALLFTSGTSGLPKGVMLSQKNLITSFEGACKHISFTENDVMLSVLPLHHAYESNCGILAVLNLHCVICFNANLKQFLSNLQLFKPTGMSLVPLVADTMFRRVMDGAKKSGKLKKLQTAMKISDFLQRLNIDVSDKIFSEVYDAFGGRFKKAFVGGAPMNPVITKAFRKLGIQMLQGYGITECSPLVSVNRENYYKDDSVGPVLPVCLIKIEEGEILVSGDNVMLGYYKNEEATKEAFSGKWFRTGDLGYLDGDGFLYITGRKKNLIILASGENVCPEELEGHIINLPLVKEVVVLEENNAITADVYPDFEYAEQNQIEDIQSTLEKQIDDINRGLPRYKHVTVIRTRDVEFEKTTTKKIIRYKVNGGNI